MGLLLLALVFQSQPAHVTLELTHPKTQVQKIILDYGCPPIEKLTGGYHTRPHAFVYWPELPSKHPFEMNLANYPLPRNLPWFQLTTETGCMITEQDWQNRRVLKGAGNEEGSVMFAELLLNIGLEANQQTEFELEEEAGFRGVAPTSAEVTLLLPEDRFWEEDDPEQCT